MARILVATSAEPRAILEPVLKGHDLSFAETLLEAVRLLNAKKFDQILCTVVFDDSRMFDLLRLVKSQPTWRTIPFVCARVKTPTLNLPLALEAVAFTCRELGAAAFLDLGAYTSNPEQQMRDDVDRLLPRPS